MIWKRISINDLIKKKESNIIKKKQNWNKFKYLKLKII